MHPDEAVMLRGLPPVGRPEPVWWRLEELLGTTTEHAERLRREWIRHDAVSDGGVRGYDVVWGWDGMALVAGLSRRQIQRAARRGHLPVEAVPPDARGPGGAQVCVALSCLLRYARWRMGAMGASQR